MSCFLWHNWGKWEQNIEDVKVINKKTGVKFTILKNYQKRLCKKCGKVEREEIKY